MKKIILFATPLLLLINGCKTREDIARDQMVTQISGQVKDSPKAECQLYPQASRT